MFESQVFTPDADATSSPTLERTAAGGIGGIRDSSLTATRDAAPSVRRQSGAMTLVLRWGAALTGAVSATIALVLLAAAGVPGGWAWIDPVTTIIGTGIGGALGALILQHATGAERRVGVVLIAATAVGGITTLASVWAEVSAQTAAARGPLPLTTAALILDRGSWLLALAGFAVLLTLFPTGRLISARWRALAIAEAIVFPLAWLSVTFLHKPLAPPLDVFPPAFAPVWFSGPLAMTVTGILVIGSLGCLAVSVASVFRRTRGADDTERAQLLWVASAATLLPLALAVCLVELPATGSTRITGLILSLAVVAVPAAVGAAVLRLGLYRIDRIAVGAVAFAVTLLAVAVMYSTLAAVIGWIAGWGTAFRGGSFVSPAIAAIAVLVGVPLYRRCVRAVERGFDRERFAGTDAVDAFARRLSAGEAAPEEIEDVLRRVLSDRRLRVLVSTDEADDPSLRDMDGHPWQPAVDLIATPAIDGVVIAHDSSLATRPRVLAAVIDHARLALQMVRLRATLANALADARASRDRIVTAGYEERHRLERDLHDGAQQQLLAVGITLRLLQRSLPDASLEPLIDRAVGEVEAAIAELRRIAVGVRPPRLDEGLVAALHDLTRASSVPLTVSADAVEVAAPLATAAYYIACEAVTNAERHAHATTISISLRQSDGVLTIAVSDDGIGGARRGAGSGLVGLEDRVAAHGGTLQVESPLGQGTRLEARLPCGS